MTDQPKPDLEALRRKIAELPDTASATRIILRAAVNAYAAGPAGIISHLVPAYGEAIIDLERRIAALEGAGQSNADLAALLREIFPEPPA